MKYNARAYRQVRSGSEAPARVKHDVSHCLSIKMVIFTYAFIKKLKEKFFVSSVFR